MFAFTIIGFILEGGMYRDFQLDVMADSPVEAMEKARLQDSRTVVSNVSRKLSGWNDFF